MKWFKKKKQGETAGAVSADADVSEPAAPGEPIAAGAAASAPAATDEPGEKVNGGGLFGRLKSGLSKTRDFLNTDIDKLFSGGRKLDEESLEKLEERLITADMGVQTTMTLMEGISKRVAKIGGAQALRAALKEEILALMPDGAPEAPAAGAKPRVVMVVGVNGVGKTTTIGKLAARSHGAGQRVLIAAADTFRAAAIEQLSIWAERAGADIVRHRENADPAAVAYDGVTAAVARDADLVLVDTAGRLHTKVNLMEELKKIKRSIGKVQAGAPHDVLLVLDATTGQNALSQVKLFHEAIGVTGIALTKLDGTAKGGVAVGICHSFGIPLKYIGVGEKIDDLQDFDPVKFIDALF